MSSKKNKKSLIADISEAEIKENPFLAVVYQKKGFVEKFHELDYDNQIKAYQTLVKLSSDSNTNNESKSDAFYKLQRIMESIGLDLVERQDCFLSKDERLIIRMDFYGTIDRMQAGERKRKLSKPYLDLIASPLKKRPKMADYDFASAPVWPLFARFKSFRKIEKDLARYMVKNKINPKILTLMNVRDFSDLIVRTFEKSDAVLKLEDIKKLHHAQENLKKYFTDNHIDTACLLSLQSAAAAKAKYNPSDKYNIDMKIAFAKPTSVRKKFVMSFVTEHENEIRDILLQRGYDSRYANSFITVMKKYGATKTDKLVITETHFTDQILKDFKRAKIDCKNFKKGSPIPQELIDYLIQADLDELIIARDNTGKPLRGFDFPSFEVHHKHAVSASGDLSNIASINYKDNLCLVLTEIHNSVLHGLDIIEDNKRDAYSRRTEFTREDTAFMAGFEQNEQICCSYFDTASRKKNDKEDCKNYTTYEECMHLLAKNQTLYEQTLSHHSSDQKVFDVDAIVAMVNKSYEKKKKRKTPSIKQAFISRRNQFLKEINEADSR